MAFGQPKSARMSRGLEVAEYVAAAIGMAVACSGFAMIGQLFSLASGVTLVLAILTGGMLCVVISLSIGEMASMLPSAPGVRTYFRAAFGDGASLAITFVVFMIIVLFAGVEALAFQAAVELVWPGLSVVWSITGVLGIVTALNVAGVDVPRRAQLWLGGTLVALIVIVSVAALGQAAPMARSDTAEPSVVSFLGAVGGAVFLYTGFEWVTPLGRRPTSYRAMVPWSMPVALVILTAIFALMTVSMERRFPLAVLSGSVAPHILLGRAASPRWGHYGMVVVSALATLTTFNAGLMGASRLLYGLSRERRFPRWGGTLWDRTGVPVRSVLALSGACWASALVQWISRSQNTVAVVCATLYAMLYAGFVLAARRLRTLQPNAERPFRSPVPALVELTVASAIALVGVALLVTAERPVLALSMLAASIGAAALAAFVGRRARTLEPTGASASPTTSFARGQQ